MTDVKALMENRPEKHWTQRGLCRGDDRFTGRFEWLSYVDQVEMATMCMMCPVFLECNSWADSPNVVEVFAAGKWRYSRQVSGGFADGHDDPD